MKLVNNNRHSTGCDTINYLAISQLELLGVFEPTQMQIDYMEKIIRISLHNAETKFKQTLSGVKDTRKPELKLVKHS